MEGIFTENSFYYFYSTVPQVLAGGIALIGAFLIFFITESNKKMFKILRDTWIHIIENPGSKFSDIRECIKTEYNIDLLEIEYIEKKEYNRIVDRIYKCSKGRDQFTNRNYNQFKIEFYFKSLVINRGIRAVILSGILMAISIFILPFIQYLIKCLPLGIFITVLIIGFSCYAIYLIADVVVSAIRKL
jgi:hypothetical protein